MGQMPPLARVAAETLPDSQVTLTGHTWKQIEGSHLVHSPGEALLFLEVIVDGVILIPSFLLQLEYGIAEPHEFLPSHFVQILQYEIKLLCFVKVHLGQGADDNGTSLGRGVMGDSFLIEGDFVIAQTTGFLVHKLGRIVNAYSAHRDGTSEGLDTELQAERDLRVAHSAAGHLQCPRKHPEGLCLTWTGQGCRLLLCLLKVRNDKLLSECLSQEHSVTAYTLLEEISV